MFKLFGSKKEKPAITETESVQLSANVNTSNVGVRIGGELSDRMSDKKLVAIVTSAIAASRGKSDCAFDVISINKIS